MKNLKTKIAIAGAAGTILLNAMSPLAYAATTVEITGNGSSSQNSANISKSHNSSVVQENNANIQNNINANSSTGGNRANDNTNGDVLIDTGNASTMIDLLNRLNLNHAKLNNCDCDNLADILISGNGSQSDNDVNLDTTNDNSVFQSNDADISNDITSFASTGQNKANRNTGGDVIVFSGNADSHIGIQTKANANISRIGNDNVAGSHKSSYHIIGNGSMSDNSINAMSNRSNLVVQDNSARVRNTIDINSITGKNKANDNTNADVLIDAGQATALIDIENMANFNAVHGDCGCLINSEAMISGNGSHADSNIRINLDDTMSHFLTNISDFLNYININASSGDNDANRNTGSDTDGSSVILSGHSMHEIVVENSGNVNLTGEHDMLDFPSDFDLEFHFDLGDLMRILIHR